MRRAQDFVPDYRAAPSNPEGEVLTLAAWTKDSIPDNTAIICRNNAPLFKLAFRLLRQGRGVRMLGNDIGKALERVLIQATKKLPPTTKPIDSIPAVNAWFDIEIAKAKTNRRKESLSDRHECLLAILEATGDLISAKAACHRLFENPLAVVTLASGHKAKGLEWDTVIHLDSYRIPSPYASTPEEQTQEANIRYVIETRAKSTLILANLDDFT